MSQPISIRPPTLETPIRQLTVARRFARHCTSDLGHRPVLVDADGVLHLHRFQDAEVPGRVHVWPALTLTIRTCRAWAP